MKKTLFLTIILLIALPTIALAAYSSTIYVVENGTAAYDMIGCNKTANVDYWADNGYIGSKGLDTRITKSGSNKPHMLVDDRIMFAIPVPISSTTQLAFTTGSSNLSSFYIIPGYDGYITAVDNSTIELGDNFSISQTGWINTDYSANRTLVYKPYAFKTYISADEEISASIAATVNVTYRVSASADDYAVQEDSGVWEEFGDLTGTYVTVGYFDVDGMKKGSGMRFRNVTIPAGATVLSANLTFDCATAYAGTDVNSVITGELSDNSAVFSDLANYQGRRGTIVGGANNDYITTANITWDAIPAWVLETAYTSPDISTIIQEQLDHNVGLTSANTTLFWDDHGNRSTNGAIRVASTWDHDAAEAPLLSISYSVPDITVTATGVSSGEHEVIVGIVRR